MQTTLCVPLDVRPEACSRLTALIEQLKQREDDREDRTRPNFAGILEQVPTLHFMSMSIFPGADYDPIFILEANFDGPPGVFWAQLEARMGDVLRLIVRCTKPPRDQDGALYAAVTAPDSRVALAPYLEARTQRPSVFHHGNRGMSRDRILAEKSLFRDLAHEIDGSGASPYRGQQPGEVHRRLRAAVLARHPWLNTPAPKRIRTADVALDVLRALWLATPILLALLGPGLILAALRPGVAGGAVLIALLMVALGRLSRQAAADAQVARGGFSLGVGALALGFATLHWDFIRWPYLALAVASGAYCLGILLLWLRGLELRDSPQDDPPINERTLRDMLRREDWVTQNHMGSIVLVKPGVLRTLIVRIGHAALQLILRLRGPSQRGYLGSMRTVHFAHWAFLNNHSRLLFFSNFDHSWDSYLDDFIEKAHTGLTLAWGCGVGFPVTRLLMGEGAAHGRQFKTWALASRTVSRFWFSAYPDLTVDQIERNNRIANGLRKRSMGDAEARKWMRDL